MIIQDIQHADSDETRRDGRYPDRIGCKVDFYQAPHPGSSAMISYIADNNGRTKRGLLITSIVKEYQETHTHIMLTTLNSKYLLLKEPGDSYTGVL